MNDRNKTKSQLIEELEVLRARLEKTEFPEGKVEDNIHEKRLSSLFTSVQCGVLLQSADGRIIRTNKIASDILGIPEKEVEGRNSHDPVWKMVDESGTPVPGSEHPSMITFQTGNPVRNVVRGLFSDKPEKTTWLLINTEPVFGADESRPEEVLITFADITEFKKLEESCLSHETRFNALADQSADCLIIHDLDGNIKEVNDQSCLVYQYPRTEFLEMNVTDLDPGYTEAVDNGAFWKKINPYEPVLLESRHQKKDGSVIPVEVRLNLIDLKGKKRVMTLCRDISERLNFLREAKRHKNNFLNIIENNPDAVIIVDKDQNISYANSVASKVFGRPKEQLIGSSFGLPIASGAPTEIQLFSPGDQPRFGEMRIVDSEWENKDAWLVMIRDITDRKNAEDSKNRALKMLKEKAAETEAFLSSANSILTDSDFKTTARHIYNCCVKLCGAKSGYVALLSEDGGQNDLLFLDSGGLPCSVDPSLPMPVRGLRNEVYQSGKALFENNFPKSEWQRFMPEGHVELKNVMFAPLNIEGKTMGVMGIANKEGGFTREDAVRATAFGDLAAIALHKSRTTEALHTERLLLNFAIDQMPIPVIIANAPEGRISKFNRGALELMAQPAESISEISLEDHPKYWPASYPDGRPINPSEMPLSQAINQGKTTLNQEMIIRKDEFERWVSASATPLLNKKGEIVAGILVLPEITDLKATEAALKESRRILDASGKMAKIGGWEHNFITGKAVWTKTVYDIIEIPYGAEPPGPSEHLDFYPPEDRETLERAIEHSLEHKSPFDVELQVFTSNKKKIWCRVQGEPVFKDNQCIGIRGTFQDISDRKYAEQAKARLEEQYQQSQKVESIGRLAGGVAHDLNNLLSPIIGYSEMLRDELPDDFSQADSVDEILKAGLRAKDLVRQLLAFSRKQTLEYRPVSMPKVFSNFEKLLRRTIREDIAIKILASSDIPTIMADVGQLEQVIMNLAVNAQDAMPEGGTLTIECSVQEIDQEFVAVHTGAKTGTYVLLSFRDTGIGMDEGTCRQVFEPFFSTKGKEGTGLGLSTVYGIVKQHGGSIWVYSQVGNGTTFDVYLPVSDKLHPEHEIKNTPSENPKGSERILLVEDDANVLRMTTSILKRHDYQVLAVGSGSEALKILEKDESAIDLLLTDVIMPEMNGKDLFKKALCLHPELKVIFMSGYTNDIISSQGILDENTSFIQKPFSVKGLTSKVREVLDS